MKNFNDKEKILNNLNNKFYQIDNYGTWSMDSFKQNIKGLNIKNKLAML